jgi:hypothetical protein
MNVLHGRGFETILISLILHLLPPLSPMTLDTHYLTIIGLIRCIRSWRTLRGIGFRKIVDPPRGFRPIGTEWVWKNKEGEKGEVVRNKSRLVAQGFS